ncbi:MAG: hypothetical protein NVSMB29_16150 [Candidatus Dormibacteria bacterium]
MKGPRHAQVPDVGLQNERTSLAWFRTGLSFAGVGALLLRSSDLLRLAVPGVLGALALAAGGAGLITAGLRYAHADAAIRSRGAAGPHPRLLAATAALTLLLPLGLLLAQLGGAIT